MKLRNNPRFWIMLVSGVPMIVGAEWLIVLKLTNSLHSYPTVAVTAVMILFILFIGAGFIGKKN